MWRQANRDSKVADLRHERITNSHAADSEGRRAVIRGEMQAEDEAMRDENVEDHQLSEVQMFAFDFKSIQKPFQMMLYQHHDKLRRDVSALWSARKQFESVLEEYQKFKESGRVPHFADSFSVPKCVLGVAFPVPDGPAAGRTIQEVINSFKDSQLATKVDHMVKVKEAVVEHFKAKVSLEASDKSIKAQLDNIVDELRAMALGLDFGYESWFEEAKRFARMSFEHILFAAASKRVRHNQNQEKITEKQTAAQSAFTSLPKEAQLELMIESKVSQMMTRGKSSSSIPTTLLRQQGTASPKPSDLCLQG